MDQADHAQPSMGGGSHFQGVGRGSPQREWSAFSRRGREFWAGTKPLTFDIEIEVLQDVCEEAVGQAQPREPTLGPEAARRRGPGPGPAVEEIIALDVSVCFL